MIRKIIPALLSLALAVMACQVQSATPAPVVPTLPPVPTSTPVPPAPALTLDLLKNGTYFAPFYEKTVTLINGEYTTGAGTADPYSVRMLDMVALGDLNGDGLNDAAVVLVENGGGSGQFESVVGVINKGGAPTQVGYAKLGDRVKVNSLTINSAALNLDLLVQGPNDAFCCPSQPEKQTYRMVGNTFWLTRLSSFTPDNQERAIIINAPADNASVQNPFTISGSVTMAPFENTLVVRIYLPDETKLNESPLMVDSGGIMGGPGKFTKTIDLSNAGITGPVIIQFLDLSAADGSSLAIGSIVVNIK